MRISNRPAVLIYVLLPVVLLMLTGCSNFESQWKQLVDQPRDPNSLEGCWEGQWHYEGEENGERLRCIVTKITAGHYNAWYKAWFAGVFTFERQIEMSAELDDENLWRFEGIEDLGAFGGVFRYEGFSDGRMWEAKYSAENDSGRFAMEKQPK